MQKLFHVKLIICQKRNIFFFNLHNFHITSYLYQQKFIKTLHYIIYQFCYSKVTAMSPLVPIKAKQWIKQNLLTSISNLPNVKFFKNQFFKVRKDCFLIIELEHFLNFFRKNKTVFITWYGCSLRILILLLLLLLLLLLISFTLAII